MTLLSMRSEVRAGTSVPAFFCYRVATNTVLEAHSNSALRFSVGSLLKSR